MINRQVENFDIKQIMESGQCFRMREIRAKEYMVIHREYCTIITEKENGNYCFDCSDDELKRIWMPYFDITRSMGDAYHYAQEKVDSNTFPVSFDRDIAQAYFGVSHHF